MLLARKRIVALTVVLAVVAFVVPVVMAKPQIHSSAGVTPAAARPGQLEFINPDALAAALFLALIANRLLEYVKSFLDDPQPGQAEKTRQRLLLLGSFIIGFALTLATNVNLFATGFFSSDIVSRIASAVVIGGGSNLINDIVTNRQQPQRGKLPVGIG